MSSSSLVNDEAAPGPETEKEETTKDQDDDPPSNTSIDDKQDYLDDEEILPFTKSEDLVLVPNKLLILFEREEDASLLDATSNHSINCPFNDTLYQITVLPHTATPESSTCLLGDDENECYLRSITSLVGSGEGTIRSLSDILVWTETSMGTATGYLTTSHTSVTDILSRRGTTLRSMTSLLSGVCTIFTISILNRTGTILRTMSDFIGNIERRTIESIRLAFRFMTHHMSPSKNSDDYGNN